MSSGTRVVGERGEHAPLEIVTRLYPDRWFDALAAGNRTSGLVITAGLNAVR